MSTLDLHATADAVESAWRRELRRSPSGGAVELGRDHLTLADLVAAAADAALPTAPRLGPLGERLLVDAVADAAQGPYAAIAGTRGLRRSLRRALADLRRAGITATALRDAARRAGAAHAVEVARALDAYERLRGDRFDEAELFRRAVSAIAAGVPVPALKEVDAVAVHDVIDWDASRLALLDALLTRGLAVRVHLPEPRADLAPALAPTLAAFEARHARALECVPRPRAAARLDFTCATSPLGEARAVARRVRDLVDAGAPPDSIAVCAESPERRARLRQALERYQLAVSERRPQPAADAPPVRLALDLYRAVDEKLPREHLIALLSSRYVAGGVDGPDGWVPPHRVARALREAGATDASAYRERLDAWVRAQPRERQVGARAIVAHIEKVTATLQSLPAAARFAEHSAALLRVLNALDLFARARGFRVGATPDADEARAIARDQAAVRELEVALIDLPRAAARAGLRDALVERSRFARLLGEALTARAVRVGGVRGAAVELTDLAGLAGRSFAHLFVCGLNDGELPARVDEDPLLPDDERVALNRALGVAVLPLAARAEPLGALAFATAAADAGEAHLSWSRADEDGAPILRSSLLDALAPAEITRVGLEPIPRAADARTVGELRARAALECLGDRASRLSPVDGDAGGALYALLRAHDPERVARLDHLASVERERERFFAGETPPHRFAGALADEALLSSLREHLPGSHAAPLSASAVERYAACRFQFFLRAVLHAAPLEEADDDLDALARGRLLHRALERCFSRLAEERRLPLRGDPAERAILDETCAEVVDEWRRAGPVGHPGLFAVHVRRLRRQLAAVLRAEAASPPSAGCLPARFEQPFGPLAVEAPDGDERLFVRGTIDRVDIGAGRAVVLDYKGGKSASYRDKVKEDALCVTSWQLPLYAAAIRAELGGEVEARLYALGDVKVTGPIGSPSLLALDPAARAGVRATGARNIGDALWGVYRDMRAGDFAVRPLEDACARCRMEPACRVVRRRRETDDP